MRQIHVTGIGWVLPSGSGSGRRQGDIPTDFRQASAEANARLADFSAKPYLNSVKGYLDPASSFCLAASVLALGEGSDHTAAGGALCERHGICTLTRYGATLSGYRFFQQFLQKGPRYASPLVFPHSYPNTAGNLAAIEFGFGGPHMVYYGDQDVTEGLEFAAARLQDGTAETMLVTAYESAESVVLPEGRSVMHGAVSLRLQADLDTEPLLSFSLEAIRSRKTPSADRGMSAAMLELLYTLQMTGGSA